MKAARASAALAALLLLTTALASAQGPATIRGRVFNCDTGAPFAGARITLENHDDGSTIVLSTNAQGRFGRVGLTPGAYAIGAANVTGPEQRIVRVFTHVETDDIADVPIGMWDHLSARELCVPSYVRPTPPTTDRYIVH